MRATRHHAPATGNVAGENRRSALSRRAGRWDCLRACAFAGAGGNPLLTESLALVVAQHHPLAACEQVALSRLHDEKLVLLSAEFATREQIDHYCEKAGLHPQVVIEANSISAFRADSPHFPFHIVTSSDCHTT